MRGPRELTLDVVPDSMVIACGLLPHSAKELSYRCSEFDALLPLSQVVLINPLRKLNEGSLRWHLERIEQGIPLPPVPVFRRGADAPAVLLDGTHRRAVSIALGFEMLPCLLINADEAWGGFQFRQD